MTRPPLFSPLRLLTLRTSVLALLLGATVAACSSGGDRHPSLIDVGGDTPGQAGGAGALSGADRGGNGDLGGAPDSGGDAGAVSDAGTNSVPEGGSGGGRPIPGPSQCDDMAAWGGSKNVAGVSTGASETLLSITPDELDLAFLRDGALYVAHRAQASATFSGGTAIVIPIGWSASQGASLSADGKRLILVSSDQRQLGELTRTSRDTAFDGDVDSTAFASVNESATYTGKIYAAPVVSPGDGQLFYNSGVAGSNSTIVVSIRAAGSAWSAPVRLTPLLLDGADGARRLPTGLSTDERTLFYFNEESAHEEARWRDNALPTASLYDIMSLGARRGAIPNSGCDRLYSGADTDVVVEQD